MKNNKSIIDKLTALWALNESGLGGFLHVFNSPFTGLIVGGIAILLISLIAYYAENKWESILKALVIVLIIKMAVSPHSPFTAYIAVSFQALLGAFLFSNFSWKGITLIAYGFITFLQSALTKLLILTVVYGTDLWEAINTYGLWIQNKMNYVLETSTTSILIAVFLFIYSVGGILSGIFIKNMISIISKRKEESFELESSGFVVINKNSKGKFKVKIIWFWLLTVTMIVLSFAVFGGPLFGWQKAVYIVMRSLFVLLFWYLLLGPIILNLIRKYLNKKESRYKTDVTNAMDLFPYFRSIISYSWKETSQLKGYTRFKYFIANSISNCIHFKVSAE